MAEQRSAYEDPTSGPAPVPTDETWGERGWYGSVSELREHGGKVGTRTGAPVLRDGRGLYGGGL